MQLKKALSAKIRGNKSYITDLELKTKTIKENSCTCKEVNTTILLLLALILWSNTCCHSLPIQLKQPIKSKRG